MGFLAPLEVQLPLEAQLFLVQLEDQLFLAPLEVRLPVEAQLLLVQLFQAPLEVQLLLQQQLMEVLVVTTTHGLRRATSATNYFLTSPWTTLLRNLLVKLLELTPTWQLQRLRQSRMCSTICGQPLEMTKLTPGSASTIAARKQVLATTPLMELSLSQMDPASLLLRVLSTAKMSSGTVMTISRTANLWLTLQRDKSRIASRLIKL